MNSKIANLLNTTKTFIGKHSPEILTGIGIMGMISSTILAVKATPKAMELIKLKKKELETTELKPVEVVKTAWKPYIPAVGLSIASISCIVGASTINYKRNAALASAYAITERTLIRYRDKVVETLGEKGEKKIREEIAQDQVTEKKTSQSAILMTNKGNTLLMDTYSGRYFRSDLDEIRKVVNKLNRDLIYENYIPLNDFYYEIGLDNVKNGSLVGWNLAQGLIEPIFTTCLAENDEPCVVMDFKVEPKYDYDKLM